MFLMALGRGQMEYSNLHHTLSTGYQNVSVSSYRCSVGVSVRFGAQKQSRVACSCLRPSAWYIVGTVHE